MTLRGPAPEDWHALTSARASNVRCRQQLRTHLPNTSVQAMGTSVTRDIGSHLLHRHHGVCDRPCASVDHAQG